MIYVFLFDKDCNLVWWKSYQFFVDSDLFCYKTFLRTMFLDDHELTAIQRDSSNDMVDLWGHGWEQHVRKRASMIEKTSEFIIRAAAKKQCGIALKQLMKI